MPRATEEFYEGSLSFGQGNGEVVDAAIIVHQYQASKKTGDQQPPMTCLHLRLQRLDGDGKPTPDEPIDEYLKVEAAEVDERGGVHVPHFRPGMAKSADDDDPKDLGSSIGTKGNCIYAEDGHKVNASTKYGLWVKSALRHGLKPGTMGYLQSLLGLKAHFASQKMELGANADRREGQRDPMALVVDKIIAHPTGKSSVKAKAGPATKTGAEIVAEKAAAAASGDDADTSATAILAEVQADYTGQTIPRKKLFTAVVSKLAKDSKRDKKLDKAIQDLVKSDDWLLEKGAEMEFSSDTDSITFVAP